MRTIGKHWPADAPHGDYPATCDYCGATWRRSQLRRDRAGLLKCPDEGTGADSVALTQANAQAAARPRRRYRPMDATDKNRSSS
jgi:hypothetical protein